MALRSFSRPWPMRGVVGEMRLKKRSRATEREGTICIFFFLRWPGSGFEDVGKLVVVVSREATGFHGSALTRSSGQTPEKRELRSRISPMGRTRTSRSSSPSGQLVAVTRTSSRPLTV